MPALRHDWAWPLHRADFAGWYQFAASGWLPFGIGAPVEHIERYVIAVPVTLLGFALGGWACLFVYLTVVGYVVATTGALLARRFADADALTAGAIAAFVLFNPWTYTEVVAGHIEMILGAAGIAGMLAYLTSPRREGDSLRLALYVVLAYTQLQFFLIALVLAASAVAMRRGKLPLLTAVSIGMPTFVGVAGNFASLSGTPTEIPWARFQSIDPGSAWRLLGYFTSYADAFVPVSWAIGIVCVAACAGVFFMRARKAAWCYVVAAGALLLAVTGLRGPLASVYASLLQSFPPLGVYRELYDLVGLLVLCYAAAAAGGAARSRVVRALLTLASAVLVVTWLATGITRWWVPAQRLPAVDVAVGPTERYALTPAFQPFRFGLLGDGADPDAFPRAHGVVSLNEYDPRYPGNAALARFSATGDTHDLAALGVAAVYGRSWLEPTVTGREYARSVAPSEPLRLAGAAPLVSLLPLPALSATGTRIGAGDAFFGDVAGLAGPGIPEAWRALPRVRPIVAGKDEVDPARGWVDARLAFIAKPQFAQPFGGVLTSSSRPYALREPARGVLADVEGRLSDADGAVVGADTGGYRWLSLPSGAAALHCEGTCALALFGDPPALEEGPDHPATAVPAEIRLAWLVVAHVPAGSGLPALRLNERYDPHWVALAGLRTLPHFRLDGTVNGWLDVPAQGGDLYLLNVLALLQALFQIPGALWVVFLLVRAVVYWSP